MSVFQNLVSVYQKSMAVKVFEVRGEYGKGAEFVPPLDFDGNDAFSVAVTS